MKDLSKKTKLTIIGILLGTILLVTGITYAYFTAATVGGNSGANSIQFITGTHGNITVNYYDGDGTINMNNIDLKEAEQGTTEKEMVKFSISYPGNQEEKLTIMWKEVFNTFCQYQTGNVCTNTQTDTFVGDEIYFNLYECDTETNFQSATTTTLTGCTDITRTNNEAPITSEEIRLQNTFSIPITNSTKYYIMILNIDNLTTPQDYNQGRTFRGRIEVTNATTDLEGIAQVEGTPLQNGIVQMESVLRVSETNSEGEYKFENIEYGDHTITIKNGENATIASEGISIVKGETSGISGTTITSSKESEYLEMNTTSDDIALAMPTEFVATFGENNLTYNSRKALGYKLLTDNKVIKTTTPATTASGAAPVAGTNIVSENGIYRATDDDGYTYYYRGGEGCSVLGAELTSYTEYATCSANNGYWSTNGTSSYKCYTNGTSEVCEANGGTWYYLNNNVKFAGFNWKVVRINGDGSIRIALDGITSKVKKEGSAVAAGSDVRYNNVNYDTDGSSGATTRVGTTLEEQNLAKEYASYNGGELEGALNTFYETYIDNGETIDYSSYLADSSFCSDITWGDTTGSWWSFVPHARLDTNKTPSYICPEEVTYKVGGTTGIRLTYPIAALSADEIVYAGGRFGTSNSSYYLTNPLTIPSGSYYWTMSPGYWYPNGNVGMVYVGGNGYFYTTYVSNGYGVRAVLNLNSEVLTAGGNGTVEQPYIIGN